MEGWFYKYPFFKKVKAADLLNGLTFLFCSRDVEKKNLKKKNIRKLHEITCSYCKCMALAFGKQDLTIELVMQSQPLSLSTVGNFC